MPSNPKDLIVMRHAIAVSREPRKLDRESKLRRIPFIRPKARIATLVLVNNQRGIRSAIRASTMKSC